MKISSQSCVILASSLSLFTINFSCSQPAHASIVCEPRTITSYQNGSLATCVLGQDINIQVSTPQSGTSNFVCKQKNSIVFDDKGQFQSCVLAQEVVIRKGNTFERCPAEYKIDLSISDNNNQLISCHPYINSL